MLGKHFFLLLAVANRLRDCVLSERIFVESVQHEYTKSC
ncbi:hypothetical protein X975_04861, partial [Stegodyphus mimosarum]